MKPCDLSSDLYESPDLEAPPELESAPPAAPGSRREFLKNATATAAGLTCLDFLSYFARYGLPWDRKASAMAADAKRAEHVPRHLVYWFVEGGWMGYDLFNPLMTPNHVLERLDNPSDERYRVLEWGEEGYGIYKTGNIRHGYLANAGKELLKDCAVLSSMHTGTGHSTERLRAHMGSYRLRQREEREDDERSVNQAFAEAFGQSCALPNLSWHWWLSDGELNVQQYLGRRGFYHALGPSHAHTIYPGTPRRLKGFLLDMVRSSGDRVAREVESFLADPHRKFLKDENIAAVKSYHSARQIWLELSRRGLRLDPRRLRTLFSDPALREEFGVTVDDELHSYRSVNGNKARSKFSPNTNVQAMMTYELLRAGLSCTAWIESRDVRGFDSHRSRSKLWKGDKNEPVGQLDTTEMLRRDLWDPLKAFVHRLKSTPSGLGGESLFDHTTIVLTSEFGRSIHGNVDRILASKDPANTKAKKIGGQDISAHWKVCSAAFLGGQVEGDRQYGGVGESTLHGIPLLSSGRMDPAFDPLTGEILKGRKKDPRSRIPGHGEIYSTALELAGLDPKGKGRNEAEPLRFIKKGAVREV